MRAQSPLVVGLLMRLVKVKVLIMIGLGCRVKAVGGGGWVTFAEVPVCSLGVAL